MQLVQIKSAILGCVRISKFPRTWGHCGGTVVWKVPVDTPTFTRKEYFRWPLIVYINKWCLVSTVINRAQQLRTSNVWPKFPVVPFSWHITHIWLTKLIFFFYLVEYFWISITARTPSRFIKQFFNCHEHHMPRNLREDSYCSIWFSWEI